MQSNMSHYFFRLNELTESRHGTLSEPLTFAGVSSVSVASLGLELP